MEDKTEPENLGTIVATGLDWREESQLPSIAQSRAQD